GAAAFAVGSVYVPEAASKEPDRSRRARARNASEPVTSPKSGGLATAAEGVGAVPFADCAPSGARVVGRAALDDFDDEVVDIELMPTITAIAAATEPAAT